MLNKRSKCFGSLTLKLSNDHSLCYKSHCDPTLLQYSLKKIQIFLKDVILTSFDPPNLGPNIQKILGFVTLKISVELGSLGVNPLDSYIFYFAWEYVFTFLYSLQVS
jgi:hypothetical protein